MHMNYARRPWSDDDVKLLTSMSLYFPAPYMAGVLNRSETAVRFKLRQLGIQLRARGYVQRGRPSQWTEPELRTLRRFAGTLSSKDLMAKLPRRTSRAIRLKAASLGLTLFKSPWSQEELDKLLTLHAAKRTFKDIAEQLGRSEAVCRAKYSYLTRA
jgi:hypothetical protein